MQETILVCDDERDIVSALKIYLEVSPLVEVKVDLEVFLKTCSAVDLEALLEMPMQVETLCKPSK